MNKNKIINIVLNCCVLLMLFFGIAYCGPLEDCAEYTKIGIPSTNDIFLCRKGFLEGYDKDTKIPKWVIEHLTSEKASSHVIKRMNSFVADPDLLPTDRAELSDYAHSGYDRGHMAPAEDMEWDENAMQECFYLSNMVPQTGIGNNRGIWKVLEMMVHKSAIRRGEIYIITGPIYNEQDVSI